MRLVFLGTMNSSTPTTINTLPPMLEAVAPVKTASPFKNRIICFLDLLRTSFTAKASDLVFIHTYSTRAFYYAWACAFICRLRGVKYIAYLHGGSLPERIDRNNRLLNRYFVKASAIITPSLYLKVATEKRGFGPVRLIPNFINLRDYPFKQRENLQPKLLWVRAFHQVYNPELAIWVLAELSKKYGKISLCMVGPDKDGSMERCRKLAGTLRVLDRLTFTGRLSKQEWVSLAANFDIFINTTNVDNTPVSVIEAMALGLPIVSTNVGGIPYLLEHGRTARLVNKNDRQMMINEINRLLENKEEAAEQAKTARKLVESFAWEQIEPQWVNLVNNLHGHY